MTGEHPVRVLILESATGPGGSISALRNLVVHLDGRKIEPSVALYSANPSQTIRELRAAGVWITFLNRATVAWPGDGPLLGWLAAHAAWLQAPARMLRFAWYLSTALLPLTWKVARLIHTRSIEVVLLNQDIHYHIPGVLAARLAGVPCVCRKAGGIGEARWIKRLLTPWVDVFVSISRATEADQRRHAGTRELTNIYGGVDLPLIPTPPSSEAMRRQLGLPAGRKVVASISRIAPGKGQVEFLRMAAEVLPRYRDVVFLVAGDEEPGGYHLTARLKTMCAELGIEDSVVFTGWRDDIPSVLTMVDILVHCPTTFIEGLCIANLEAMAMGKPTVVSHNGGLPEAVLDGVTGFVIPPGNVPAMAEAVLTLLTNATLAASFGARARLRVEQLFNAARNAGRFQEMLIDRARCPHARLAGREARAIS